MRGLTSPPLVSSLSADVRLWVAACGGLLGVSALLIAAWTLILQMLGDVTRVESERLPKLELLQQARYADLEASLALRNALLFTDPSVRVAETARAQALQTQAAEALRRLNAKPHGPEGQRLLLRVLEARARLQAARAQALKTLATNPDAEAIQRMLNARQATLAPYLASLQALADQEGDATRATVARAGAIGIHIKLLLLSCGVCSGTLLVLFALSWRRELRQVVDRTSREIALVRGQRDALVGEVHHRIKNHLQGLLSLIEQQQSSSHAETVAAMSQLQRQVLALMSIHGLQAQQPGAPVSLVELVRQQVRLAETGHPQAQLGLTVDPTDGGWQIDERQCVPVALAISELLTNAIKHGVGSQAEVHVRGVAEGCEVQVSNRLPPGRSFDWRSETARSRGLSLIDTLMHGVGQILQHRDASGVTMVLRLPASPPQSSALADHASIADH